LFALCAIIVAGICNAHACSAAVSPMATTMPLRPADHAIEAVGGCPTSSVGNWVPQVWGPQGQVFVRGVKVRIPGRGIGGQGLLRRRWWIKLKKA
jgi:hypothetical protein